MIEQRWFETLVGLVVVAVAAVFLTQVISRADLTQPNAIAVTANFLNADGLAPGTDVRLAGVKVGRVKSQELDPQTYEALLTLEIDKSVPVPDDSSIKVLTDGLLGGNFIALEPGGSEQMLADGGHISLTSDAVNLIDLISTAIFSGASSE